VGLALAEFVPAFDYLPKETNPVVDLEEPGVLHFPGMRVDMRQTLQFLLVELKEDAENVGLPAHTLLRDQED
jgi:hypothetical protein